MTMTDGILRIEFEKFTFQVRDNLISVDNRTYGAAKKGDVVLIGLNGEIAVNGTVREPSAE
jgi:hypothetical protein